MPLFKKRPLIVEAIQYEAGKAFQIEAFVGKELERHESHKGALIIPNEDGTFNADTLSPSGWLAKEPDGSFKVYGADEFIHSHEPAVKKRKKPEIWNPLSGTQPGQPKVLMVEKKDLISQDKAKELTAKPDIKK